MRLIDADALLSHQIEANRMGAMLVVRIGHILRAPTIETQLTWVKTLDRLPTAADANANGLVATCYRDEWDCFSRFEKWCDVCAVENLYWHRLLKAPEVESDKG